MYKQEAESGNRSGAPHWESCATQRLHDDLRHQRRGTTRQQSCDRDRGYPVSEQSFARIPVV